MPSDVEITKIIKSLEKYPELYYDVFVNPSFTYNSSKWEDLTVPLAISDPSDVAIFLRQQKLKFPLEWLNRLYFMRQVDVSGIEDVLADAQRKTNASAEKYRADDEISSLLESDKREQRSLHVEHKRLLSRRPVQTEQEISFFKIQDVLTQMLALQTKIESAGKYVYTKIPIFKLRAKGVGGDILKYRLIELLMHDPHAQKLFAPFVRFIKDDSTLLKRYANFIQAKYEREDADIAELQAVVNYFKYPRMKLKRKIEDEFLRRVIFGDLLIKDVSSAAVDALLEDRKLFAALRVVLQGSIIAKKYKLNSSPDVSNATRDQLFAYMQLYLDSVQTRIAQCASPQTALIEAYTALMQFYKILGPHFAAKSKYDATMTLAQRVMAVVTATLLQSTELTNNPKNRRLFAFLYEEDPKFEDVSDRKIAYIALAIKDLSKDQLEEYAAAGIGTDLEHVATMLLHVRAKPNAELAGDVSVESLQPKIANGTVTMDKVMRLVVTELLHNGVGVAGRPVGRPV